VFQPKNSQQVFKKEKRFRARDVEYVRAADIVWVLAAKSFSQIYLKELHIHALSSKNFEFHAMGGRDDSCSWHHPGLRNPAITIFSIEISRSLSARFSSLKCLLHILVQEVFSSFRHDCGFSNRNLYTKWSDQAVLFRWADLVQS